jgi:hypothetical protein
MHNLTTFHHLVWIGGNQFIVAAANGGIKWKIENMNKISAAQLSFADQTAESARLNVNCFTPLEGRRW